MEEKMEMTIQRSDNGGVEVVPADSGETKEQGATENLSALAVMKRSVGMTLVEIMIVITIIAMVSGGVGYFVFGALDTANEGVAENDILRLNEMVQTYSLRAGGLPDELSDLTDSTTNLLEEVPEDPWGNEYIYERHGPRDFTIYSAGADGTPGTDADIHSDD